MKMPLGRVWSAHIAQVFHSQLVKFQYSSSGAPWDSSPETEGDAGTGGDALLPSRAVTCRKP